ncbi:hypothetical protein FTV88_2784 [Heliorestis convoluta]|uniref:Uncharacterized protein n=1 Tax=Heliorestis convoluta TaxID=356322 RepID=A0A5Q2N4L8_9FIRM|nr:hypothetical protein FTV88_2784 [Heliorestis convoluta]
MLYNLKLSKKRNPLKAKGLGVLSDLLYLITIGDSVLLLYDQCPTTTGFAVTIGYGN